jgi:hypothetical protein
MLTWQLLVNEGIAVRTVHLRCHVVFGGQGSVIPVTICAWTCIARKPISYSTSSHWVMRLLFKIGYTHSLGGMIKPLQYMPVYMYLYLYLYIPCNFVLTIRRRGYALSPEPHPVFWNTTMWFRKPHEYVIFADQCKFKMELLLLYSGNL